MQAHDSVAVQEMAEENVTQHLGETVKLVRLEKARDTPLVRRLLLVFLSRTYDSQSFKLFMLHNRLVNVVLHQRRSLWKSTQVGEAVRNKEVVHISQLNCDFMSAN